MLLGILDVAPTVKYRTLAYSGKELNTSTAAQQAWAAQYLGAADFPLLGEEDSTSVL